MGVFDNYECEGQMSIFDFIGEARPKCTCGEWVTDHGRRVKFDEIKPNKYYVVDYSTNSHRFLKTVYTKEIKGNDVHYVDSERGVTGEWNWGNSYSCLTRRKYVDGEEKPERGESKCEGFWYEVKE